MPPVNEPAFAGAGPCNHETPQSRPALDNIIADRTFAFRGVPLAGDEIVPMNLWLSQGAPPMDTNEVEPSSKASSLCRWTHPHRCRRRRAIRPGWTVPLPDEEQPSLKLNSQTVAVPKDNERLALLLRLGRAAPTAPPPRQARAARSRAKKLAEAVSGLGQSACHHEGYQSPDSDFRLAECGQRRISIGLIFAPLVFPSEGQDYSRARKNICGLADMSLVCGLVALIISAQLPLVRFVRT